MATQTPNYGLHQWEPSDNFLRTDFNTDFQKIDTALGQKAEQSTVTGLEQTVQQKIQMVTGTYNGDNGTRTVDVGFRPKAVLVCSGGYTTVALDGASNNNLSVTETGFTARHSDSYSISVNRQYNTYVYWVMGS